MNCRFSFNALTAIMMAVAVVFTSCDETTPVVNPQRTGLLSGAPNFRDLGGYPGQDGKQTVWRKVFRSEAFSESKITDEDIAKLSELGIRTVIDFRSEQEVAATPSRLPEGVTVIALPIVVGNLSSPEQLSTLDSLQAIDFMKGINRQFVMDLASTYQQFFEILLQPENYPIVFHCTAGKDRTGFAAAMLLSALGVNWDTVMEDYMLTNQFVDLSKLPENMPGLRQIMSVHSSYLTTAKETIDEHYDNIDDYLLKALEVDEDKKASLRELLLH
ncbi:MAG: tyrosine-protein phosphatase [Tannerellaceae bacterium]|jgi:protein-tyrosine phosphatase|nr:tyrosine-protein phosphatase [Tannerellaceae bacterium]